MVTEYGMSERLGAVTYEPERRPVFLPAAEGFGSLPCSQATAREIDEEGVALDHLGAGQRLDARALVSPRPARSAGTEAPSGIRTG